MLPIVCRHEVHTDRQITVFDGFKIVGTLEVVVFRML